MMSKQHQILLFSIFSPINRGINQYLPYHVMDHLMRKLTNLFKSKSNKNIEKPTANKLTNQQVTHDDPAGEDDIEGVDLRVIAELKADRAGEKWREEAIARGEIKREIGGPKGLEPTRYGDWEKAGRCVDF
jgi:hypothetical protein